MIEAEASGDADAEVRLLQSIPKLAGALAAADQGTISVLVDYALKRRFGWSEVSCPRAGGGVGVMPRAGRASWRGAAWSIPLRCNAMLALRLLEGRGTVSIVGCHLATASCVERPSPAANDSLATLAKPVVLLASQGTTGPSSKAESSPPGSEPFETVEESATERPPAYERQNSGLLPGFGGPEPRADEAQKNALNECLDHHLDAVRSCRHCRNKVIIALRATVASDLLPFVRGQTHKFFYEWLKTWSDEELGSLRKSGPGTEAEGSGSGTGAGGTGGAESSDPWLREGFPDVQFIMVAGLTDVWSAIRKACANRMFGVIEAMSMEQVQSRLQPQILQNPKNSTKIGEIIFAGIPGLAYVGNLDMYPVLIF